MGREIRMVPKGWEHPRDKQGRLIPMFDEPYKQAADKWLAACIAWANRDVNALRAMDEFLGAEGEENKTFEEHPYYWEWTDRPPKEEWYRPEFDGPADHFQIYETISEGTPVSPVFATKGEMAKWLVDNGYSEEAAAGFVDAEWAPSLMICNTGGKVEIHQDINMHGAKCRKGGGDAEA